MKATALRSDLLMNGETNQKSGIAPTVMKIGNLVRMVLCSFGMPASMTWKSLGVGKLEAIEKENYFGKNVS
jgi:hypothetical protein